jgi:hypothetical protein
LLMGENETTHSDASWSRTSRTFVGLFARRALMVVVAMLPPLYVEQASGGAAERHTALRSPMGGNELLMGKIGLLMVAVSMHSEGWLAVSLFSSWQQADKQSITMHTLVDHDVDGEVGNTYM